MKFPTFCGDMKEYKRFKEIFQHCCQGYSEIESLYQLTECMENKREKDRIKGAADLKRAWYILDQYYGDTDKIIDALLLDIESLKPYHAKGSIVLATLQKKKKRKTNTFFVIRYI